MAEGQCPHCGGSLGSEEVLCALCRAALAAAGEVEAEGPIGRRTQRRLATLRQGRTALAVGIVLTVGVLGWVVCSSPPQAGQAQDEAVHAVRPQAEELARALTDGDWQGIVALAALPAETDGDSIRADWERRYGPSPRWSVERVYAAGDWAVVHLRADQTLASAEWRREDAAWVLRRLGDWSAEDDVRRACRQRFERLAAAFRAGAPRANDCFDLWGRLFVHRVLLDAALPAELLECGAQGRAILHGDRVLGPERPGPWDAEEILVMEAPGNHSGGGHAVTASGEVLWLNAIELLLLGKSRERHSWR